MALLELYLNETTFYMTIINVISFISKNQFTMQCTLS